MRDITKDKGRLAAIAAGPEPGTSNSTGNPIKAIPKPVKDTQPPDTKGRLEYLKTSDVIPTPENPRRKIDQKAQGFVELCESVRELGILQPLVARPHPTLKGKFDLRAGNRRHLAAEVTGLAEVPVMVRLMDDRTAMEITVLENLQREDLQPLEEARGVDGLLKTGHVIEEIAARLGKTRGWIVRRAQLTKLIKPWQEIAEKINTTAAHLELIARYDGDRQKELLREIGGTWNRGELFEGAGSLDKLRKRIDGCMRELKRAPWDLAETALNPKAGACNACPRRSGCHAELFEEETAKGGDRCLDTACWQKKMEAFKGSQEAALRKEHPGLIKVHGEGGSYGKGALDHYAYKTVAAKTAGAVPAFVMSGKGEGNLIYVKPDRDVGSGSRAAKVIKGAAAKQAVAALDPAAAKKALAEKREAHEKRRWAFVCNDLQERLDKADLPAAAAMKTAQGMCALVSAFGTSSSEMNHEGSGWNRLQKFGPADTDAVVKAVWKQVRPRIREKLQVFTVGELGKRHHDAIKGVAGLLCLKVDELKAKADEEIPEPKSWKALRQVAEAPSSKRQAPKKTSNSKLQTSEKPQASNSKAKPGIKATRSAADLVWTDRDDSDEDDSPAPRKGKKGRARFGDGVVFLDEVDLDEGDDETPAKAKGKKGRRTK